LQRGALKKAEQEGLEKARYDQKRAIAKNLLAGMDDAAIAKLTGLSETEIKLLRAGQ
jgi:hypothetical protein